MTSGGRRRAAARGPGGRWYPWGEGFDRLCANTRKTHLCPPGRVGVFPAGDSPLGPADMGGNGYEWTSTRFGGEADVGEETTFGYPYDPDDGREAPDAPASERRGVRGGGWDYLPVNPSTAYRTGNAPDDGLNDLGLGIAVAAA